MCQNLSKDLEASQFEIPLRKYSSSLTFHFTFFQKKIEILDSKFDDIVSKLDFLAQNYNDVVRVQERKGSWDKKETIQLSPSSAKTFTSPKANFELKESIVQGIYYYFNLFNFFDLIFFLF